MLFARKVHCQGGKINPWIPVTKSISLHISYSYHQHSDGGLQFVLVRQICNSRISMLHIWVKLSCILYSWKWQALPKRQLLLDFWILPIHPCLTLVINKKKNSGSHSSISGRTWHVPTQFSFQSKLSGQSTNLASIQGKFRLPFWMLWTHPNEIPNILELYRWLLFLRTSSFTVHTLLCPSINILGAGHPQQQSHCSWTRKTTHRPVSFPLSALQKLLSSFQKFLSILHQMNQNLCRLAAFPIFAIFQICHHHSCNNTTKNIPICQWLLVSKW